MIMPAAPAPVWTLAPEPVASPDATRLRRAYYDEVASRYWRRPATTAEVDEGLAGDGAELLTPPTGQFVVGWHGRPGAAPEALACGGVLLLDAGRAELTRVYISPRARGTGGGARLLAALEDAACGLGARRVVLNTRLDLVEARALYRRNGYEDIEPYCTGPYVEVWYGKDLTGPAARG
ncbi:GNAT family N-acetyltransferase [Streptomyces sp. NPDC006798]|uniref:GNAT family N-acetyltransferase n=1 Tax=Streptomyces sp. NPDC006798 TaxID=3155462 RepID=UPI00340524E7